MRRVRVNELKQGMIIADDIFDTDAGISFPIVCRGVVLNRDLIGRLQNRHSGWVYVALPEECQGSADETIDVSRVSRDIGIGGSMSILCDIPGNRKIEAGRDITVYGSVESGCRITSRNGSISLRGTVKGSALNLVTIVAHRNITATKDVIGADIKASGRVTVKGHIVDSSIVAGGDINAESSVVRSQLYSESKIMAGECGNEQREQCLLIIKSSECIVPFRDLLKTETQILKLREELNSLQEVAALIDRIGRRIEQVPQEKKAECAQKVNQYRETQKQLELALSRKTELKNDIVRRMMERRVFILGTVHPNVRITIENCTYCFNREGQSLAFFVKDDKMSASPA